MNTNPSRLWGLSGAPLPPLSQPALGVLLRDFPSVFPCRLASSGLLWLALAPSFLSLSSFTRNKEEIRLWGLSGASVWALCIFSFTRYGERRIPYGLLWTCSGPLLSLFLLLSLLWGSFSGTSPESLLVVWPPLGSSGWLWPPPCWRIQSGPLWICSGLSYFTMRNERKTNRKPSPAVSQASPELILLSSLLRTCTRQVSSESHCCVYAREK